MSIPNRPDEGYVFRATARELQFFVVGVAVGIVGLALWRGANVPSDLGILAFVAFVASLGALAIARTR